MAALDELAAAQSPGGEGLDRRRAAAAPPSGAPCPTRNSPSVRSPPANAPTGRPWAQRIVCATTSHGRPPRSSRPDRDASDTVLAASTHCQRTGEVAAGARYSATCASPPIRLDRLVLPLDPPFPAAWDPVPRRVVRGHDRPGRDRRGRRRASARATRWTASRRSSTCSSAQDPLAIARHVRVLETIDFHAGRYWPLEAALWDIARPGRRAARSRRCSAARRDGIPAYASCGMLLPPAERAESALRLRDEGFRALKIRVDPRRLEEGLAAVAATRDAVGDSMAIMVDLNQGWRMAGDTSRSLDPVGRPRDRRPARRATTSCGSRSRWPARTCAGLAALRALGARDPHRRRRDDPDVRRAAGRARGRRVRRLPARRRPRRRDVADADRSPSSPSPATAGSRRTPGRTGSGCWPTCTSRPASAAGRSSSSRTTRPAGRPSGATSCSPSPIRPDRRRGAARPGRAGSRHRPRRGAPSRGTPHEHRHRAADRRRLDRPRRRDRAADRAVHRRSVRAGGIGPDVRRHRRARRLAHRGRSPRAASRTSTGRSPPPGGRSTIGAGRTSRRPTASASCSAWPSSIREHREELALLESLDVGKPIRDTLSVDVPSAATTIQWYAETIDKVYGEIGPTGPDALSLVTREPIGVVAAIVPWNYPLDHHGLEARRGARDRQLGRPQAGQPVAADAPSAWPSWPPRPACPTASSTS